ncbi:histone-lysine N-methyltransferase SETMAR [Trichonephila inaurata madagascariensis]|uniref:Histone-lysine N-methyltransferase SETMAR n=1 Tax=Trichonephila inaurata madagascariensis TaxID=2747483 RepID=A0A8X6YXL9_9ARAC|nr:histone-lysine N-methyltransferase SETMAR [Trichonephila inaurata madagascariensis]
MQVVIEEDRSPTFGELASQFNTFSEEVILHLQHSSKTYRLSKWVLHTLLEVHKQQRVAACLSLLSRCIHIESMLTSDEKWILYDTPKRSEHLLSPKDTITTISIHWTIIFMVNPSPMKQTCAKLSRTSLRPTFPEIYRKGIEQLETRWLKVLNADGDYFED